MRFFLLGCGRVVLVLVIPFLSLYCSHCPENKSAMFLHDIRVCSLNHHTRVEFDPRLGMNEGSRARITGYKVMTFP